MGSNPTASSSILIGIYMKRIGVAGYITKFHGDLLLGRRGKDPNRGLYVLPGGGVEDGETLEQAFAREILEETGYEVAPDPNRWKSVNLIELDDRLIIIAKGSVHNQNDLPKANSDLYEVGWFPWVLIPFTELSPVIKDVLHTIRKEDEGRYSYHDPYDYSKNPPGW